MSNVKTITSKDIFPTSKIVLIFNESPSKIIANFKIFLEVNVAPRLKTSVFLKKQLSAIPINIAITEAPIICIGNKLSIQRAKMAITKESPIPGSVFKIFIDLTPIIVC